MEEKDKKELMKKFEKFAKGLGKFLDKQKHTDVDLLRILHTEFATLFMFIYGKSSLHASINMAKQIADFDLKQSGVEYFDGEKHIKGKTSESYKPKKQDDEPFFGPQGAS